MRYDPKKIEAKWQKEWLKKKTYEPNLKKPRGKGAFYNLMMFPYPSAEGLHVGNMYAFVGSDIYGRFCRMRGLDVFEPMGLDGFGIHSENYALKVGKHPMDQARTSERNFYRQLAMIGNGFSWNERLETYDPEYYKWTQWIFVRMFKRGLAYRKRQAVNWCPSCKTVLADEQVISEECERCGATVVKKELEQWFFRTTKYAGRLLRNLEKIDWSEKVKIAQKNWIGKSEGALIRFPVVIASPVKGGAKQSRPGAEIAARSSGARNDEYVEVFTTRPDTLYGATYMVLAPEHPLLANGKWQIANRATVDEYIQKSKRRREADRIAEGREKTGVELKGVKAINPATKEEVPVWVADYVLASYGTGAIMAVPAHDGRDFEFAKKYSLPVKIVIEPETGRPAPNEEFRRSIVAIVEDRSSRKFLTLNWGPKLGGTLFIGGGREGDEDEVKAALREIKEETGYSNLEFVAKTERMHHHYFAFSKNVARSIEVVGLHFRLAGNERGRRRMREDEKGNFKAEWLTKEEILRGMGDENHLLAFRRLILSEAYAGKGKLTGSGEFDGLDSEKAKWEIAAAVGGQRVSNYRLRDWLISRQRYWGPPIPMIFCEACAKASRGERKEMPGWHAVLEKDLPVKLPRIKNFRPTGTDQSPLAAVRAFYQVRCPKCRAQARRETDVSDTFLDSAWYYLRYPSVRMQNSKIKMQNDNAKSENLEIPWDQEIARRWLPVDMYIGGAEHSVLHLLYSRFLVMVFHDWGMLDFEEPFSRFRAHGLLIKDGAKMSKSKGNVVNPDEYVRAYGADAFRTYLMFLGPFEHGGDFRDTGIRGITRFLERVWKFTQGVILKAKSEGSRRKVHCFAQNDEAMVRILHQTIKKVTDDIASLRYNTAISALMILLNKFEERPEAATREHVFAFLQLLAPFAPFIAEELWRALGGKTSIHGSEWPAADSRFLKSEEQTIVVQVNGRVRDKVSVRAGTPETEVRAVVLGRPRVREILGQHSVRKFVYVPGRIMNIVTG